MTARTSLQFSLGAAGPVLAALAVDVPQGWQDLAACKETDPEIFYPEKGGSVREAKAICCSCEVRAECLAYALEHAEGFGIWGGVSERDRRRMRREVPQAAWPALIAELIRRQDARAAA